MQQAENLTPYDERKIARAGSLIFDWLQKLMSHGYVPQLDVEWRYGVRLEHPTQTFEHREGILDPDGRFFDLLDHTGTISFDLKDSAAFERFLRSVPRSSLWERTRDVRGQTFVWAFLALFTAVCSVAVGYTVKEVVKRLV